MRGLSIALFCIVVSSPVARARMDMELRYPFAQAWPAAVRLVRVDMALPVDEKDRDNGYLLFRYREGDQLYPGSVELVRTQVRGVDGVQVIVQVPQMPRYVERMILQKLERKLQREYGEPREPPAEPPRDDGTDDEDEDEPEDDSREDDESEADDD